MALSAKQNALYFRTWNRVRAALIHFGGYDAKEAEAHRHQLTQEALGTPKSSKQFTNRDLDLVLDQFNQILVLIDGPTTTTRAATQPIKRLIHAIETLGLDDPYLDRIAQDQFKTSPWRTLSLPQLTRLRYTATSRARTHQKPTHP